MSLIQDDEQSGGEVDSHNEEAGVPHTVASVQHLVTGTNYGKNYLSIFCHLLLCFVCVCLVFLSLPFLSLFPLPYFLPSLSHRIL